MRSTCGSRSSPACCRRCSLGRIYQRGQWPRCALPNRPPNHCTEREGGDANIAVDMMDNASALPTCPQRLQQQKAAFRKWAKITHTTSRRGGFFNADCAVHAIVWSAVSGTSREVMAYPRHKAFCRVGAGSVGKRLARNVRSYFDAFQSRIWPLSRFAWQKPKRCRHQK